MENPYQSPNADLMSTPPENDGTTMPLASKWARLFGAIIDGIHTQAGFSMPATTVGQRAFILSDTGLFMALSVPRPGHAESGSPYPVAL